MKMYVGNVVDRMGALKERKTKWYQTWGEAHRAAEKLAKRHSAYGSRFDIKVKTKEDV